MGAGTFFCATGWVGFEKRSVTIVKVMTRKDLIGNFVGAARSSLIGLDKSTGNW